MVYERGRAEPRRIERTAVPSSAEPIKRAAEEDNTVPRDRMEPIAFIRKQVDEAEPDLLRDWLVPTAQASATAAIGPQAPDRDHREKRR